MNEKQFRSAVQLNTKCGKKALDIYCMDHGPEYTDEEYNDIIRNDLHSLYYRKNYKTITTINDLSRKLIYVEPSIRKGRKKNGYDV